MRRVYLDHSASAPLRPEAAEAMQAFLRSGQGNPSSLHAEGRVARRALEEARAQVAALLHCDARDLIFTSGATEANNLALRAAHGPTLAVSAVEHPSVLRTGQQLQEEKRARLITIPVDAQGVVEREALAETLVRKPVLLSLMYGNNETGVLQPVREAAALCRATNVLFHCDAVQAARYIRLNIEEIGADMLTLSAHKLGGPAGVGALYVRRGLRLTSQMTGGAQEGGRRAGTENLAGIVGFGVACEIAARERAKVHKRVKTLRDALQQQLQHAIPGIVVNSGQAPRLPHILNLRFPNNDGERLLLALDHLGIAVSTGAACSSGEAKPSHVLLAMGQTHQEAQASLRFSFGPENTQDDVDRVVAAMREVLWN